MPPLTSRLGYYYYPDTEHYRQCDIARWLPELRQLGAAWLVLAAPSTHTIPEGFIKELLAAGITPILHLQQKLGAAYDQLTLKVLFDSYARWNVRYLTLFDRPNLRNAWPLATWSQSHLPERFLDDFLPLAESALACGLTPVLPPLEPGGDYWDITFLRQVLRGICRRGSRSLCEAIVVGAYAWPGNRPLDWGSGGPQCWPRVRPYGGLSGSQDHRGFRIFEWYGQLAAEELERDIAIILLATGVRRQDCEDIGVSTLDTGLHTQRNLEIARLLLRGDGLPKNLLAGNLWLLAAAEQSPGSQDAWYPPNGEPLALVPALKTALSGQIFAAETLACANRETGPLHQPIAHYLLLPSYAWGIADWHLEVIRPYVKKHQPTVGFSLAEAALARHITVIGGEQAFPETELQRLRNNGSLVERIEGYGTEIATYLASL